MISPGCKPREHSMSLVDELGKLSELRASGGLTEASWRMREQSLFDEHRRVAVVGRLFPRIGEA